MSERAKIERQYIRDDYAAALTTAAGRRMLARILRRCAVDAPVFSSDPLVMAHAEGRRSIGIELRAELRALAGEHWPAVAAASEAEGTPLPDTDQDGSDRVAL